MKALFGLLKESLRLEVDLNRDVGKRIEIIVTDSIPNRGTGGKSSKEERY